MDLQTDPGREPGITDIVQIPGGDADRTSLRDAARTLASFRIKQRNSPDQPIASAAQNLQPELQQESQAEPAADAAAAQPQADAGDEPDVSRAEPPGGADATANAEPQPADAPPIEPPQAWTPEEKERFKSLPRDTQDYLAAREQERERDLRKSRDEAAAERKAIEAERHKVAEARQRYEQALPALVQSLSQQQAVDFSDVKDVADIERLAREDWPRYVQWDAQQKRIASVVRQIDDTKARQAQERKSNLEHFVKREHDRFVEKAPEFADEAQRIKLQSAAVDMLKGIGFAEAELLQMWRGERDLSVHDHRLQLLIRDGIRWRDAQQKAKQAAARPVPPVVRPGVARPMGAARDAAISNLTRRLDQTGNLKDAARLIAERRKAAR